MMTFATLRNRYVFRCQFAPVGGLHVGSGTESSETDALVMKTGGMPFVPGSSVRGALRSVVERVARSLDIPATANVCTLFEDDESCLCAAGNPKVRELLEGEEGDRYFAVLRKHGRLKLQDRDYRLCVVCQLFGSTVMAARLKVGDARVKEGKVMFTIRDGVAINRDTGTAEDKKKFDFEVVESESDELIFECDLEIANLTANDAGLLYVLLAEWRQGIFLGGKKARGLGLTQLRGLRAEYFDSDRGKSLVEFLKSGKPKQEDGKPVLDWLGQRFEELCSMEEVPC